MLERIGVHTSNYMEWYRTDAGVTSCDQTSQKVAEEINESVKQTCKRDYPDLSLQPQTP